MVSVLVVIVIAAIAGVVFYQYRPAPELLAPAPQAPQSGDQKTELYPDDMILGRADALVTIIEYASFSCPHCAKFHVEILPSIKKDYIDTGKVKLVFRDFPLNKPALEGAMLARCSGPMRYFGMADMLFREQNTWLTEDSLAQLAKLARIAGIDQASFDACQADTAMREQILKRMQEDQEKYSIEGTPTFIMNDEKLQGVQSYEGFQKIIDAELERSRTEG